MIKTIYLTGFRDKELTTDELSKIDEYKNKYNNLYKLLDKRDAKFESALKTYKDEGKNIVLYAETDKTDEGTKSKIVDAAKELKSMFSDIDIEVNDEDKKLL